VRAGAVAFDGAPSPLSPLSNGAGGGTAHGAGEMCACTELPACASGSGACVAEQSVFVPLCVLSASVCVCLARLSFALCQCAQPSPAQGRGAAEAGPQARSDREPHAAREQATGGGREERWVVCVRVPLLSVCRLLLCCCWLTD